MVIYKGKTEKKYKRVTLLIKSIFSTIFSFIFFLCIFPDPPDITVDKSWVHTGEGYETQLVCIVHADPQPTVSII